MSEHAAVRVEVHAGIGDDGRAVWFVTLDGPAGTVELLQTCHDPATAAELAAERRRNSLPSGDDGGDHGDE